MRQWFKANIATEGLPWFTLPNINNLVLLMATFLQIAYLTSQRSGNDKVKHFGPLKKLGLGLVKFWLVTNLTVIELQYELQLKKLKNSIKKVYCFTKYKWILDTHSSTQSQTW